MNLRVFSFLLIAVFCTSCQFFKFDKKNDLQNLDTIVDFSSVDSSPSFTICDSLIDKDEQTDCFRTTIHQKIADKLSHYTLQVKHPIDEVITVEIIINNKGNIIFESLFASDSIKKALPKLDSLLKVSVESLPTIFPAIKMGIPVSTQYQLPIRIKLKE